MPQYEHVMEDTNWSFKSYFHPFTTTKAIHFLILIGFLVFGNMLVNGFVWDDFPFILNNPEVHQVNLFAAFGNNYFNNSGYYRPLPEIYFSLMYAVFGTNAFFYHLTQLLLHTSCSIVIFLLFKTFFSRILAFFLAVIFLVHPINVESVSYIAATQSQLFFLPGIIALFLSTQKSITTKRLALIIFLLTLSLFTKETGLFFLIAVIVYRFFFTSQNRKYFIWSGVGIIAVYCLVRFLIGKVYLSKISFAPIAQLSFDERLTQIPFIITHYLQTFFFPLTLAIDQQWVITDISIATILMPLLFVVISIISLFLFAKFLQHKKEKQFRVFLFFTILFVSSLGLLVQLFPLDMTVADRWFYFPMLGILGMLGCIIQQVSKERIRKILPMLAIIIIILLATRTIVRNTNWYNLLSLYSHDVQIADNFDNRHNYGVVLVQNGQLEEGLENFLIADSQHSTEFTLRDTGLAYLALDKKKEAYEYLTKAFVIESPVLPPHHHQTATYEALGRYHLIYKEYKKAQAVLDKGIIDYPYAHTLWYLKAVNASLMKDREQALRAAQKAYTIYPSQETYSVYKTLQENRPLNFTVTNR